MENNNQKTNTMETMNKMMAVADCNKPATDVKVKLASTELRKLGKVAIPEEFAEVLKQANGMNHEGAQVFGANLDDSECYYYADLVAANEVNNSNSDLLLGESEDYKLIFNGEEYMVIDRAFNSPVMKSKNATEAVAYFLDI